MSRNTVSDVLLNDVARMFLGDGYLAGGVATDLSDSDMSDDKLSRTRYIRNSLRLSFSAKPWQGLKRSKSGDVKMMRENGSEVDVGRRRAISVSPQHNSSPFYLQPVPAPLLVEDPPSSDNVSDLEDVRHHPDPALLNGSSGNFGSAGARSAPSTPQGLLASTPGGFSEPLSQPCSPGYVTPSIQRSPSHNLFSKYDKGTLQRLSYSTPAMTAQAHSPEPPSPKATSKDEKPTSKARQKKFRRHFPAAIEEDVLNYYSCALIGDILLQGHLYITTNYFAFYSNVFGYVTKLLIPMLSVEMITKEKTARIIPNAIGITTVEDKHVFGSLMSRDSTYRYMHQVWDRARNLQAASEPTILPHVNVSDLSDSSETREESGRESAASEVNTKFTKCTVKPEIRKTIRDGVDGPVEITLDGQRTSCISKQRLLLFASTLLLVLLFLSAAVLLYRIGRIQHKYSLALQDNFAISESEDVYSELFQWQTHLHSKSAGAVHNFLDTNLDQIAKVRQSLEALSTLLMPNESNVSRNTARKTADIPNDS